MDSVMRKCYEQKGVDKLWHVDGRITAMNGYVCKGMEETMVKIGALGHRDDYIWLNGSPLLEHVQLYEPEELQLIPASEHCLGSVILVGSSTGLRVIDMASLIRQGHSLFIYDILFLTEEELGTLFNLAEEAGVYIFPRLPQRAYLSPAESAKPLVATIEVEIAKSDHSVSWLNHCINSVALAVSLIPFGVKRTRFVSGNGLVDQGNFFGCQLEFENSSLASVSVSNGSMDGDLHIRVVSQSGICRYSTSAVNIVEMSQLYPLSALAQLELFLGALEGGDTTIFAQELRQSQQILHIYHDLEARFVHA